MLAQKRDKHNVGDERTEFILFRNFNHNDMRKMKRDTLMVIICYPIDNKSDTDTLLDTSFFDN